MRIQEKARMLIDFIIVFRLRKKVDRLANEFELTRRLRQGDKDKNQFYMLLVESKSKSSFEASIADLE